MGSRPLLVSMGEERAELRETDSGRWRTWEEVGVEAVGMEGVDGGACGGRVFERDGGDGICRGDREGPGLG